MDGANKRGKFRVERGGRGRGRIFLLKLGGLAARQDTDNGVTFNILFFLLLIKKILIIILRLFLFSSILNINNNVEEEHIYGDNFPSLPFPP